MKNVTFLDGVDLVAVEVGACAARTRLKSRTERMLRFEP